MMNNKSFWTPFSMILTEKFKYGSWWGGGQMRFQSRENAYYIRHVRPPTSGENNGRSTRVPKYVLLLPAQH